MKKILLVLLMTLIITTFCGCKTPKKGEDPDTDDQIEDIYQFEKQDMTPRKYKVIMYSTAPAEDNPFDENFPKDKLKWKAKLQHTINELQKKYDCNFEVRGYPNGEIVNGIEQYTSASGNSAAIARVNTNDTFIDLVTKGYLQGMDEIISLKNNKIVASEGFKQMINNKNQLEIATLEQTDSNNGVNYSKTYGVSRFNDVSMFNLFLYNSTMISKAGLEDPLELWKKGQWTWQKMEEMKIALKSYLASDTKYTTPLPTFDRGARPYAYSFQFWLFDLYAQRTGKTLDLNNLDSKEIRDLIDEWKEMYYNGDNWPSRTQEMTGSDSGEGEIKYEGKWDRYHPNNWSPNQHNAARCFNKGRNAFTNAEVWTYRDYILAPNGSPNDQKHDFKIKIVPFPTNEKCKPENSPAKIMGLAGDMLVLTKGKDKEVTAKFLLELNKAWVDNNLDEEIIEAKKMTEYSNKTNDELKAIAKTGEIRAKLWVRKHLLGNGNITEAEFDICVEAYKYYSDTTRLVENKIDKYGLLLPILHAVHRYAIDGKDLTTELNNAKSQAREKLNKILEDIKK